MIAVFKQMNSVILILFVLRLSASHLSHISIFGVRNKVNKGWNEVICTMCLYSNSSINTVTMFTIDSCLILLFNCAL